MRETIVFPQAREYTKRIHNHHILHGGKYNGQIHSHRQAVEEDAKRILCKTERNLGTFNPVTRTVPNGKAYNRNKLKQEDRRSGRLSYGKQDSLPLFVWLSIEVA